VPKLGPNAVPSYRLHKQSGQAIVTLSGRDVLLGRHGAAASRDAYNRAIAQWLAAGRLPPPAKASPAQAAAEQGPTVSVVLAGFLAHARTYYRTPVGGLAGEFDKYVLALGPVRRLYGVTSAAAFGPLKLKAVMQEMVKLGWCRTSVNRHAGRVKAVFKWAASVELLPSSVFHALQTVAGLRRGRSNARESDPVKPAPASLIDAVLPIVSPQVRAMIELQLITGMRPAEACVMRRADIDTSDPSAWLYRPAHHKTEHHGHERVIYLGSRSQQILTPFLTLKPNAYLFSPAEAEAERHAQRRDARKTKVQPSQAKRNAERARRRRRTRKPGDRYDVASYRRAIARACEQAFPPPAPLGQAEGETRATWRKRLTAVQRDELAKWIRANRFHPHQLRHNAATSLRKRYGLEVARIVLGHRSAAVTEIYAEADLTRARQAMTECG
jgi:integrase